MLPSNITALKIYSNISLISLVQKVLHCNNRRHYKGGEISTSATLQKVNLKTMRNNWYESLPNMPRNPLNVSPFPHVSRFPSFSTFHI